MGENERGSESSEMSFEYAAAEAKRFIEDELMVETHKYAVEISPNDEKDLGQFQEAINDLQAGRAEATLKILTPFLPAEDGEKDPVWGEKYDFQAIVAGLKKGEVTS